MYLTSLATLTKLSGLTHLGWMLVQVMTFFAKQTAKSGAASGLGDGDEAEAVCVGGLLGSSFGSLQLMTGGALPTQVVDAIVHLLNGRLYSAVLRVLGCKR